ncbi:TMEM175 family protein [Streptomyces sp. HUAS TT11]|uniref:TMEM175 family protein n=1 Tax=Streptomyces sp. HUAS TT11 TaxID=3447508 RepID=UPI003F65F3B0
MAAGPGSRPDSTQGERPGARGAFRATCTGGVEAFSNGVFAVAITVLTLEMSTPAHPGGGLLSAQVHRWPATGRAPAGT